MLFTEGIDSITLFFLFFFSFSQQSSVESVVCTARSLNGGGQGKFQFWFQSEVGFMIVFFFLIKEVVSFF